MAVTTKSLGISQSDILLRAALVASLQEIRVRPDLLDHVFVWLPKDDLTASQYGQSEADQAKKWFMSTDVPVVFGRRLDTKQLPCVSVTLLRDGESRNTLEDRFYEVSEYTGGWPDLTDPFVPEEFYPYEGKVKVPAAIAAQLHFVPGQVLVDRDGEAAPIREVLDSQTFLIDPNQQLQLSGATVRGQYPPRSTTLRSAYFSEEFQVGCHVLGDHSRLFWLYAIVKFALLRGRRRHLEGRGLDISSIAGSDLKEADFADVGSQLAYSRYLTIQGLVLNTWPDDESDVVQSVSTKIEAVGRPYDDECVMLGEDA